MSLQFATQKLEYSAEDGHLKQSDIGQIIFNNRSERDLMAQAALARLIKVNNLNTGSHFGGKIKNCIDLKTSSKQNKLQQIKTNNQNHISQSIKTNQQAMERLEKDLEKDHER